jgi:NhaP-type Na+/H+ or K+/H+ antiporter
MTLPLCILLGCLACPTDPSATLAVVHECKAKGPVVSTIMGVAAFDDALGIVNYSLGVALATLLIQDQGFSLYSSLLEPAAGIAGGMAIGAVFGLVFNRLTLLMEKETEGALIVVIFGMLCLCFGIASGLYYDELLATMTMGCVVVNYNPKHEQIFTILERYTEELIFVLFFTLSGMHLNFSAISGAYVLIFFFVLFRGLGKVTGTMLGAFVSRAPGVVRRYAALGLIPQGGIVIGLALMIKNNPALAAFSDALIGIVIGATVIHELIGPVTSKTALVKAGETRLHNQKKDDQLTS